MHTYFKTSGYLCTLLTFGGCRCTLSIRLVATCAHLLTAGGCHCTLSIRLVATYAQGMPAREVRQTHRHFYFEEKQKISNLRGGPRVQLTASHAGTYLDCLMTYSEGNTNNPQCSIIFLSQGSDLSLFLQYGYYENQYSWWGPLILNSQNNFPIITIYCLRQSRYIHD